MKKLIFIAILLIGISFNNKVYAENYPIGEWNLHPAYSYPAQKIIETDNLVYFIAAYRLFSYDKENDETYSYTLANKLNDSRITNIFYNFDKKYLLVVYDSGNMDFIYDDGHVVNVSDIRDSSVIPPLTINDVAFDGNRIYVATAFGLVEFTDKNHTVVQSGIYNKPVNAVTVASGYIVIHAENNVKAIKKDEQIKSLDNFKNVVAYGISVEMQTLDDNTILIRRDNNSQYLMAMKIDFEQGGVHKGNTQVSKSHTTYSYLNSGKNGKIFYVADNNLYTLDENYKESLICTLPEELKDKKIGTFLGKESLWSLAEEGLANYSISEDGNLTIKKEPFRPEEFSVSEVYYFFPSHDQKYLFAQNLGSTNYKFGISIDSDRRGIYNVQQASQIELSTGDKKDISLYPVNTRHNSQQSYYKRIGLHPTAITGFVQDPDDPDVNYLSSAEDGIYKVKNGEYIGIYNNTNSPLVNTGARSISYGVSIDRGGNLWVSLFHNNWSNSPVMVLPAEKRKLDPSEVTEEDWYVPDFPSIEYWGGQDVTFLHCKKSNMIFIIDSDPSNRLLAYNTKGTFNNFSDDTFYLWEFFVDQDGNIFDPSRTPSIIEDKNGRIWVGTSEGVIEIANPTKATDPSMKITHIKVPRNDGTNLADYLLGTDLINSISVDVSNRKWLATDKSGLFLVSPSGNEIIESFTKDNSPLPDNRVNAVYADPNSSTIYIGMKQGLYTYSSNATPPQSDYSEIYAYPNPVRPDYGGDIYVRGLMDNSLVKIADSSGTVVYQGRSEGGLFTWSGCNSAGVRVPTGIYYVFVSQSKDGSSSGAVTKIMIVN